MSKTYLLITIFNTLLLLMLIVIAGYCFKHINKLNKHLKVKNENSNITHNCPKPSGVMCSPFTGGREEFFKLLPDIDKVSSLEIAPWHNPILIGKNVKYFDVLNKEGLLEKAKADSQDISKIPEIDYVHPNGDMSLIKEKFALIFSSHNIEHQVDLIEHLKQVGNLLDTDGRFFLAIPDKRFCFDHYISTTSLSDVLATHWQGAKTHSLQTILALRCETTHNDPARHWQNDHGDNIYQNDKNCYFKALKEFQDANGSYIDSHKWRFDPDSFFTIVEESYRMKLQPLRVIKVFCTEKNSLEFYAILYKP